MRRFLFVVLAFSVFAAVSPARAATPAQTIQSATDVLDEFTQLTLPGIPAAVLADAQGVVILPHVVKAGFVFGGRGGHGVVLNRDRSGAWSGPTFVALGGASVGFQAGVESADVILVFKTQDSLNRILGGRGKLTLGADAAVAAGPIGRQAEAGTDTRLRAEIVSYSRSRGLFAGVALDGAVLAYDLAANSAYQADGRPEMAGLATALLARLAERGAPPPAAVLDPNPRLAPSPTPTSMPASGVALPLPVGPVEPPVPSQTPIRP